MKNAIMRIVVIMLALCIAFTTGTKLREQKDAAVLQSWLAGDPPDPEHCSLCGSGNGMWYHAPCVLNLSTGEISELQVYAPHPVLVGEISDEQQGGYIQLSFGADVFRITDHGAQTCDAKVPKSTADMQPGYFCGSCRNLLMGQATEGYVLLDLHDLDSIIAYPIKAGAAYSIRDYTVTIEDDGEKYSVLVTADLF